MRRSRQTVYVGEVEHDVRDNVRDELSRMGFRVMPEACGITRPLSHERQQQIHMLRKDSQNVQDRNACGRLCSYLVVQRRNVLPLPCIWTGDAFTTKGDVARKIFVNLPVKDLR